MQAAAKKVIPIVPYSVKGRYRNRKSLLLALAYLVYFSLPWLTWHGTQRSGQPLLIDLATLRVNFLDLVIFPHDLIILTGLLILAVVALFAVSTLYGRVFCGFFCFQTLWTDAFRFIERLAQGEAQARLRLRRQPWTVEKMLRVGITHALWLLLAFATALTFALYFLDAPTLFARIFAGTAPMAAYTAVGVLTATTYVAAGLAREQVCLVACPYGKFQTVMQDPGTVSVLYDADRGERALGRSVPSAALKEAAARAEKGHGDCIDCGYCVKVCPTGVDIRKGFQIDCIACGLCVDACDTIMDKVQLPRGLIRFDQARNLSGQQSHRRFNPRAVGYAAVLLAMSGFVAYSASTLQPYDATVQQHAQPLVTRLANGDLRNRYILRITNKTTQATNYRIRIVGLPREALTGAQEYRIPAGRTYTQVFNVVLSEQMAQRTEGFKLVLMPEGRPQDGRTFQLRYYAGA